MNNNMENFFLGDDTSYVRINEEAKNYNIVDEIKTINWIVDYKNIKSVYPLYASTYEENTIINNVYSGLSKNTGTEIEFDLIKSIQISRDRKEYMFILRDDAYWSDGSEITAYDFVKSWDKLGRLVYIKHKRSYLDIIGISSYQAISKKALYVKLFREDENILSYLSDPIFFVQKIDSKTGDALYSGPYKYVKMNGRKFLVKNKYYYDHDKIKLELISIIDIGDNEYISKIDEDKVFVLKSSYSNFLNRKLSLENKNFIFLPNNKIKSLIINSKSNVLKNKYDRFKINKVMDRFSILDYSSSNLGSVTENFIKNNLKFSKLGYIENYIMNLSVKNLKGKKIKLIYLENEENQKISEIIKMILETNFDIKVNTFSYNKTNLEREIYNRSFDMLLVDIKQLGASDDGYMLSLFPNSYFEYSNWGSRSFEKYINEYMKEGNLNYLSNANIELYTNSYHIPLFFTGFSIISDERVDLSSSYKKDYIDFENVKRIDLNKK